MPDGLVDTLGSAGEFLDLLSYLIALRDGGAAAAAALRPADDLLAAAGDADLDHAGIIRDVEGSNLKRGRKIYEASCVQCHGANGNTPSLATARAFGREPLKFGADPHAMYLTSRAATG